MGQDPILLIVKTIGDFYVLLVLLRFLLQVAKADFYNPISQAVARLTDIPLAPIRKLTPRIAGFDFSALVLALLVKLAVLGIMLMIRGTIPDPISLVFYALISIFSMILDIYFYAVIASVIISWVAPQSYHPAPLLIGQLTEPLFRIARKVVPSIGGLDLSPILIFLVIQIVQMQLSGFVA